MSTRQPGRGCEEERRCEEEHGREEECGREEARGGAMWDAKQRGKGEVSSHQREMQSHQREAQAASERLRAISHQLEMQSHQREAQAASERLRAIVTLSSVTEARAFVLSSPGRVIR